MSPLKANVYLDNEFVESMDKFIDLVDSPERRMVRISVEDGPAQTFAELSEDASYVSCFADGVVWEWEKQSERDVLELCRVEGFEVRPYGKVAATTILVYPYADAPLRLRELSRAAERGYKNDCIVFFPSASAYDFHSYPHWVDGLGSGNIAPDLVKLGNDALVAICYT